MLSVSVQLFSGWGIIFLSVRKTEDIHSHDSESMWFRIKKVKESMWRKAEKDYIYPLKISCSLTNIVFTKMIDGN